uniref:Putative pseudouridylate synthase n=1 Tax=Ixodes ricinus TaxID=34613 RepID=V5IJH6_IXORI
MSSKVRRFLYSVFFGQRSPQLPFWSSIMSEGGTVSGAKHALDGDEDKGAKRLKSETETSNSESQLGKAKAKKMALCMSYNGKDYLGMQRNPGTKTIEDDLLQAMYKGDLILKEHVDVPQAMKFQRAARTDKGVSAVRQIVSLKLPTNLTVEEMVDKINSHLVDQIRVIDIKRTTRGFNCKNSCDSRTYTYVLPTLAFAPPRTHPAEESVQNHRGANRRSEQRPGFVQRLPPTTTTSHLGRSLKTPAPCGTSSRQSVGSRLFRETRSLSRIKSRTRVLCCTRFARWWAW